MSRPKPTRRTLVLEPEQLAALQAAYVPDERVDQLREEFEAARAAYCEGSRRRTRQYGNAEPEAFNSWNNRCGKLAVAMVEAAKRYAEARQQTNGIAP